MREEIRSEELRERFDLVENMLREGRRSTQYWGWNLVLWGVGYMVAIAGTYQGGVIRQYSWPVVMVATFLVGTLIGNAKKKGQPETTRSRALSSIWIAMAAAIFLFAFSVGFSSHNDPHILLAGILTLLGLAHAASSLILKWGVQMGVALVWWVSAVACCYVATDLLMPILIVANLIGNLGFGFYLMYAEARDKKREKGFVHA